MNEIHYPFRFKLHTLWFGSFLQKLDDALRLPARPQHAGRLIQEILLVFGDNGLVVLILKRRGELVHAGDLDDGCPVVIG